MQPPRPLDQPAHRADDVDLARLEQLSGRLTPVGANDWEGAQSIPRPVEAPQPQAADTANTDNSPELAAEARATIAAIHDALAAADQQATPGPDHR